MEQYDFRPVAPTLLLGALALAPVVIAPVALGGEMQKGIFLAFAFGLACCIFAVEFFIQRIDFSLPRSILVFIGAPLALAGLLSLLCASSLRMSLWGSGFEVGTMGSLLFFCAVVFAASSLSRRAVALMFDLFLGAVAVSGVCSIVLRIAFPQFPAGETLMGLWPQLSFVLGAAIVVGAIRADLAPSSASRNYSLGCALLAGLSFGVFFQSGAALLVALIAGVLAAGMFFVGRRNGGSLRPAFAAGAAVIVCTLLAVGARSPVIAVGPDLRPSLIATELIARGTFSSTIAHALLGAGPNAFASAWNMHRTFEFNFDPQWNIVVDHGYGTFETLAVTLGFVGLLALLTIPFGAVAFLFAPENWGSVRRIADDASLAAALALALFSLCALALYPINEPLFLMAGAGMGFFARTTVQERIRFVGPDKTAVRYASAFVLIACGLIFMGIAGSQFFAGLSHTRGMTFLDAGDAASAEPFLERAADVWGISSYENDAAHAVAVHGLSLFQQQAAAGGANTRTFRSRMLHAVTRSDLAVAEDPAAYPAWETRASLFISLLQSDYPDAAGQAQGAIHQMQKLSPSRPDHLYLQALLDGATGDLAAARADVAAALLLKPDYDDALKLSAQLGQ